MYKIFPGTFTHDGRKVSIKEVKWKSESTNDSQVISKWNELYKNKIKFWGVPTGEANNLLVLDVDVKTNGFETLKKYHVPVTRTQKTVSGGVHYFFKYPNDGEKYGNRVSFDEGLDIRGEGGYIAYYGADSTPIAEAPEWLKEQARSKRKEEVDIDPANIIKLPKEMLDEILNESCENIRNAPEGESNNILNIEAFKIGQYSNSENRQYIYDSLFEAAKDRGKPDYEAMATINSGLDSGEKTPATCPFESKEPKLKVERSKDETTRWTPTYFTRYDLTNYSKLRKPQIFKEWSTEDIHITTADGGTGKTTLKLFEAICLALGEPFLGFECVNPGKTLFITGEDTAPKLAAMIGAIMNQMGILDIPSKVTTVLESIIVKKDADLCLITQDRQGFMYPNQLALQKVMQAVVDFKPKLIVFDPISSFWGKESGLNDMSKAIARFMGMLVEKSDACVEVINHMGKASSSSKDMTQFAGRGGTGLPSHARVSRVLRPLFEEEFDELTGLELGDKSAMLCNVNKFSDGSSLYNKPFIIIREGYLFKRLELTEQKVKEHENTLSDTERVYAYVKNERSENRYPSKEVVVAHFVTLRHEDRLAKAAVERAITNLKYQGHMGERLKLIDNPDDIESKEKVFIITDMHGKDL